jgi:hypothetical protein
VIFCDDGKILKTCHSYSTATQFVVEGTVLRSTTVMGTLTLF